MTTVSSELRGRTIAVVGMARSGIAAAAALRRLGARVVLSDLLDTDDLRQRAAQVEEPGIEVRLGATPADALAGTSVVVTSPGVPRDAPVLVEAVSRGIEVMSEVELAYRISEAPMLGITGTNGKSTCAAMLADVMRAAGRETWLAGNIAADDIKMALVTAAMSASRDAVIVAEVSSFQLEWVRHFRPRVGILTNVTPDHQDRHPSFPDYVECKSRLFASQLPEDVAVLKAVNAPARQIARRLQSTTLWFDRSACLGDACAWVRDGRFVVRWRGSEHVVGRVDRLRVPGAHNVENALAVAGAAVAFGAPAEAIEQALMTFSGVPHRMERVAEVDGVLYINNSMCTNVDAAVRSLQAMHRPTVLIAGGRDKNTDFTPLGGAIARHVRRLVLVGEAAGLIEDAVRSSGFHAIDQATSLDEAVALASHAARPGDAVMLSPACTSFGMFADFEHRGRAFREAVHRLRNQGATNGHGSSAP
ncbi:MAG TPA: UDP-N-acetylmuramoyl-L-alanine--D-glutamate ligase [Chthonomonadales bacterium]|nr:UDP-N-acetylmuramoyl-L-alanine--D-glutamate ligase [Chthonomonadales bacterium]